jgi:hypothetical protein
VKPLIATQEQETHCASLPNSAKRGESSSARRYGDFIYQEKTLSCSPHRDIKSKIGSNSSFSGVEFFGTAKVRRKFEKSSKISQKIVHYSGVTIVYYQKHGNPCK